MKTEQGNWNVLTWNDIREISREANSLSTLLPDTGLCTKTRLAHVDAVRPVLRVRGLITAVRETSHKAPAGRISFPSFSE